MRKFLTALALALSTSAAAGPAAAETVIAALGDSLTHGYGLSPEDGFVPQLQRWLDDRGADVRLINAGVSGDTTAGGAARIAWTLTPEVDAVIVALGGNDVLRGIDPAVARANLDQILRTAVDADVDVLLIGIEVPANYGPEYKTAFDAIYADLADEYGALLVENFLGAILTPDPSDMRVWLQEDGLHPNAEGVSRIVAAIGPSVLDLVQRADG